MEPGFEAEESALIESVCGSCAHSKPPDVYIDKLLHYMSLEKGGCPVERHELLDYEWIDKGRVKEELQRLTWEYEQKTRSGKEETAEE